MTTPANFPVTDTRDHSQLAYVGADSTGRIVFSASIPAWMFDSQPAPIEGGQLAKGIGATDTHYVLNGAIVTRPAATATLTGMTLSNLTAPCSIVVDGTSHDCTDDHCDLSFTQPGTYTVQVQAFPQLDSTFTVTQA